MTQVINVTRTDRRFATLRVWWHCLWRTLEPDHQMLTFRASGVRQRQDFCICGYNGDDSPRKTSLPDGEVSP